LEIFYLDKTFCNINNGSFGAVPRVVMERKKFYLEEVESNPDYWFRVKVEEELKKVRRVVENLVNCDED
jgi:hercynylcysteine S-oxide lyase